MWGALNQNSSIIQSVKVNNDRIQTVDLPHLAGTGNDVLHAFTAQEIVVFIRFEVDLIKGRTLDIIIINSVKVDSFLQDRRIIGLLFPVLSFQIFRNVNEIN